MPAHYGFMKRFLLIIGVCCLLGLSGCERSKGGNTLLSRSFTPTGWERFDFVKNELDIKKPTTYDLSLEVSFDSTYAYNYFSVVFSIFDNEGNPFRSKSYKFWVKDPDGSWKSTLADGSYHFTFPVNKELSINEPGIYHCQLESHMPITPLLGVKKVAIIYN